MSFREYINEMITIERDLIDLVKEPKALKLYTFNKDNNKYGLQKLKDRFDFRVGQIVNLGLYIDNDLKYYFPCIITKVHTPDINSYNTYDYVIPVNSGAEFISFIQEEKRYLWRWALKKENLLPDKWLLDLLEKWAIDFPKKKDNILFQLNSEIEPKDLFYIDGNKAIYPFN